MEGGANGWGCVIWMRSEVGGGGEGGRAKEG